MRKLALIALMAFASPALAEDVTVDSILGKTLEEVQASLTAMGYEVRKAKAEAAAAVNSSVSISDPYL